MARWFGARGWTVVRETVRSWNNHDCSILAASMAYYAAFSFFPLLLVLLSGLGLVLHLSEGAQDAEDTLIGVVAQSSSEALGNQVKSILDSVQQKAAVGGPLGLLTLLFGAVGFFVQLDTAFDRIWRAPSAGHQGLLKLIHRLLVDRLKAFVMLLGLGLLIFVSFALGMALSAVQTLTENSHIHFNTHLFRAASIIVTNVILFTTLYKVVPRVRVRWRDALPGGILTAVIWEIGRQILALLVIGTRYSAYGIVGTFVAMMCWVYYASSVLLLGAEFVRVKADTREPALPLRND